MGDCRCGEHLYEQGEEVSESLGCYKVQAQQGSLRRIDKELGERRMRLHGIRHTFKKGDKTATLDVWSDGAKTLTITKKNHSSMSMDFTAKEWTDFCVTAWDMTDEQEKEFGNEQRI